MQLLSSYEPLAWKGRVIFLSQFLYITYLVPIDRFNLSFVMASFFLIVCVFVNMGRKSGAYFVY